MKQKFHINGISCDGCKARVKKTLEDHPNIEKAEIFMAPKGATVITMNEALQLPNYKSNSMGLMVIPLQK